MQQFWTEEIRPRFREEALEANIRILDGSDVRYVNLDNAATTKPFKAVVERVVKEADLYGSVHRGTGQHSRQATAKFEQAREFIRSYVGASPDDYVIFTGNTTEAINHIAALWRHVPGQVLISDIEHSSNLLPWPDLYISVDGSNRFTARLLMKPSPTLVTNVFRPGVIFYRTDADGQVNIDMFEECVGANDRITHPSRQGERISLVAITGASNITGYMPPIHEMARIAHDHKARILVDVCQRIPHESVDMRPKDDPGHLDFIVFSGHKVYAPFGTGVIVGAKELFDASVPYQIGGGTIPYITSTLRVKRFDDARTHEPGSPNALGVFALEEALRELRRVGIDAIHHYEHTLTAGAIERLRRIPNVDVHLRECYGTIIPFDIEGMPSKLTAMILAEEYGIGVRSGSLCAYEQMRRLKGVSPEEDRRIEAEVEQGITANIPGIVRASFSIYNRPEDALRLVDAIAEISTRGFGYYRDHYRMNPTTGDWVLK